MSMIQRGIHSSQRYGSTALRRSYDLPGGIDIKENDPTLIRIETKAGHGAGKPTAMVIAEYADRFAFALYNMGIKELKH